AKQHPRDTRAPMVFHKSGCDDVTLTAGIHQMGRSQVGLQRHLVDGRTSRVIMKGRVGMRARMGGKLDRRDINRAAGIAAPAGPRRKGVSLGHTGSPGPSRWEMSQTLLECPIS